MSNKVKENNKLKYLNDFPFIIAIVVGIVIVILLIMYLSIKPYSTIYKDGYMVLSGNMTYNLINNNVQDDKLDIGVTPVSNGDYVYKKMDSYYVGIDEKKEVEYNYPIYSSDGLTIYNINEKVTLIDRNFEKMDGYPGLSLSYGILYNFDDIEPADDTDYLFLYLNNSVYINTQTMLIKTLSNEYIVPMNSPIYFGTKYINYYIFDGKNFKYNQITDIYNDSIIKIGDIALTYDEFLLKMDLVSLDEDEEEVKEEIIEKEEESKEETDNTDDKQENVTNEIEYVKPSVSVSEFESNVYYTSAELSINDPASVITSSPMFEIYTTDDKLYSRSRFNSSGNIRIRGLSSSTKYKIVGTYKYKNKNGVVIVSTFYEGEITTKNIETLDEIQIESKKGELYSNKIEIKDLKIVNNLSESVVGTKKIVLNILEKDDDKVKKINLSYEQIRKLKKGEKVLFTTPSDLKSNTVYEYEFKFYDQDENELKSSGNITGSVKTVKKKPTVKFTTNINKENNDVEIQIENKNDDDVYIKDYKYILYSYSGKIISNGDLDSKNGNVETLKFENLDYNKNYIFKITGIYDLEDGQGERELIIQKDFTTANLNSNFTAWYDQKTLEVKPNYISLDVYIRSNVIFMEKDTTEVIVYLTDKDGNDILDSEGNLKYFKKFTKEEYTNPDGSEYYMKNEFENLESNFEYNVKLKINVQQIEDIITVEKELTPSIKTNLNDAYVDVINKTLIGSTLDLTLQINDPDKLLNKDGVVLEIYKGKLTSPKDMSERYVYRNLYDVSENNIISLNFEGYTEDSYTVFISSNPYNNENVTQYLNESMTQKNAISIDRNIFSRLEMYEQKEVDNTDFYNTRVSLKYEFYDTIADLYLVDCVNGLCDCIGYFDKEDNFISNNSRYKGNSKNPDDDNKEIVSFENKKSDGDHTLYLAIKKDNEKWISNEIFVKNHYYILSTLNYDTDKSIYNINHAEDFEKIENSKNYVVTKDLDFVNYKLNKKVYGFNGIIDFQGYNVHLCKDNERDSNVFDLINKKGVLKNAVLKYNLNYQGVVGVTNGFVRYNSGTIENFVVYVNQTYKDTGRARQLNLLAHNNTGTINKFVIYLDSDIHTYSESSLVVYSNSGSKALISNGFVSTNPKLQNKAKIILHDNSTSHHGTIANENMGTVKNIYNLVDVIAVETPYKGSGIATIVNENHLRATVKNTISVATTTQHTSDLSGPNIFYNNGIATNNYYVDTNIKNLTYKSKFNKKINGVTLMNDSVWETIINEDDAFDITLGFYPILKLNEFLVDHQQLINIQYDFMNESTVDILSSKVLKNNIDGPAEVEIYVSNPNKYEITNINIGGLSSSIISKTYDERLKATVVTMKMKLEEDSIAKSNYYINSITYLDNLGISNKNTYAENDARIIDVDMYRLVSDYNQFVSSLNADENIYLVSDITIEDDKLPENITYSAILDGNEKVLNLAKKNIERGYFLHTLTGSIKNLQITNMQLTNDSQDPSKGTHIGFIRYALNADVSNIDLTNGTLNISVGKDKIFNSMYVGGVIAQQQNTYVKYVSVNGLEIQKINHVGILKLNYIGGIVGTSTAGYIENSYVYNLNIHDIPFDTLLGQKAIGGILGYNTSTTINHCYSTGSIKTDYSNIGGIVGRQVGARALTDNYSYVLIESTGDYVGGIVGYLTNATISITNNVFLGELVNKNSNSHYDDISPVRNVNVKNNSTLKESRYPWVTNSLLDANYIKPQTNSFALPYLIETSFVPQQIANQNFSSLGINDINYAVAYNNPECEIIVPKEGLYENACATSATITVEEYGLVTGETDNYIISKQDGSQNIYTFTPKKYFNYYDIVFEKDGVQKTVNIPVSFYRKINEIGDWNSVLPNENVLLLNNINITQDSMNKEINHLLGNKKTITGSSESLSGNFIKTLNGTIKDVSFEGIKIGEDDISNVGSYIWNNKADNVGIINSSQGNIENCKFNNIELYGKDYVGIVTINNGTMSDLELQNIIVKGYRYVGSLVAYNDSSYASLKAIKDVNADSINIYGVSNVGGIAGKVAFSLANITVKNLTINSYDTRADHIGGIVGSGECSNSTITDSNINATGSFIGGVGGYGNATTKQGLAVENLLISNNPNTTNVSNYVGGVYGHSNYFSKCVVKNLHIKNIENSEKIENFSDINSYPFDSYNGNHIGGIGGYSVVESQYSEVHNSTITGNQIVGGILGSSSTSSVINKGNLVLNSVINANAIVGGIFGKYDGINLGSETVENNIVMSSVINTKTTAGGLIGNLKNNTTYSQNVALKNNLVINVNVSAETNVGGLIGNLYQIPSSNIIKFKNSLFYGSVATTTDSLNTLIGNIENWNTGIETGYGNIEKDDYETFIEKSNFKEYNIEKGFSYTINNDIELEQFIDGSFDRAFKMVEKEGEPCFPIFNLDMDNNFPIISQESYVKIPNVSQSSVVLMAYSEPMMMSSRYVNSYINPVEIEFDVYASDVDKINIEFSDTDTMSYFYYEIGNYISKPIYVTDITYTLTYDFKNDIKIYLSNGFNYKEKNIKAEDLSKNISIIENETYYINNGSLYNENKMITGNFKNLYKNEALTSDGKIYDILTKKESGTNIDYNILDQSKPLYEFEYVGRNIKTYYNYSIVNGSLKDLQLFVKNGNLSSIDKTLNNKKDMYIIDYYNNNEVQIILKEDGKLYSLKHNILYPKNILNKNISEIYSDIYSTDNIVVIKYLNGEVYTFDYRTGELLFTNVSSVDISLFDYLKEKISNSNNDNKIENIGSQDKYEEIELLKNKVIDVSIDEANDKIYSTNNSLNKPDKYMTVYNDVTRNYDIYNISNVLDDTKNLESETNKIYKDYELVKFYENFGVEKKKSSISGIILFSISIVLILISLGILLKHKANKKVGV